MRDFATKTDGVSQFGAAEFNALAIELENLALRGGESLDPAAGPDSFLAMLARSVTRHGLASISYQDTGTANNYVLGTVASFEQPTAYFDGMTVSFKLANTNTAACVVNVSSIGNVNLTKPGGTAFASGELVAGNIVVARFISANNRFEVLVNTTPAAVGAAAPDQFAVYADTGSTSGFTLAIEAGYTQPVSFTDQMVVVFKANAANDGSGTHPATFSGLGSKNVVEKDGTNPVANRIKAGDWVQMVFREVRDAFEIAFVYELPQPDSMVPCLTGASSGVLYVLSSLTQARRAPTAYHDGMTVVFRAPVANTGNVDVNLNTIGARDLRNQFDQQFAQGDIPLGTLITAQFVAADNRFRAHLGKPFTDLTKGRSAKSLSILNGAISNVSTVVLQWAPPASDPLGFYDAVNDTFRVPASLGIEEVAITFFGDLNILTGESWSSSIVVAGIPQASGSVRRVAGTSLNSAVTLTAQDVAVSALNAVSITVGMSADAPRTFTRATLAIRATKFAAL